MKITKYSFIKSSSRASECPKISYSEFAFIGRSNVGKSSLINTLVGNKKLAKTTFMFCFIRFLYITFQ